MRMFYVDTMEPLHVVNSAREHLKKSKLGISLQIRALKNYDFLMVYDNLALGMERKSIESGDAVNSIFNGDLKAKMEGIIKSGIPGFLGISGDKTALPPSRQMAIDTMEVEYTMVGIPSIEATNDSLLIRKFVKACEILLGKKEIIIKPFLAPVLKADSVLIRMVKQFPGFDDDAEPLVGDSKSWMGLFGMEHDGMTDTFKQFLSDKLRKNKGNDPQPDPLEKVSELVDWFFEGELKPSE
jgi:hypothetical protein